MITSVSQTAAFKAVYCNKHSMTKAQNQVADRIYANFYRYDTNTNNGNRYVDTYQKNNMDFVIKPAPDGYSVYLDAYEGVESVDDVLTSDDYVRVGTYNVANPFKIKDIEKGSYKAFFSNEWKLFGMFSTIAVLVLLPIITHVRKSINPYYFKTEKIIKTDSAFNFPDTVSSDKLKFNQKLYKGNK